MTTRDNMPETDLDVTLEQLGRMQRALADLNRERTRYGDSWFAVMADGPLDEISRLEGEVDRLTGRTALEAAMEETRAELWLRIHGAGLHWPNASTSVLTNFLDTLRKGVQVVAEWHANRGVSTRPTSTLKDACDFQIALLVPGSIRIGMQLPATPAQQELPLEGAESSARAALDLYLAVAGWAADPDATLEALDERVRDPVLRRLILGQVKRLLPRPRGRVDVVELSGRVVPGRKRIHLDRSTHQRVDAALDAPMHALAELYVGDMREIDLDNQSFILRNIEGQSESVSVSCEFGPELDQTAYEAIDRRVQVVGERAIEARRGKTEGSAP